MSSLRLQKYILEKMLRKKVIGAHHMRYENILSGVKSHELGELKFAVKELMKLGFLEWYDKSKKAIHINKYKLREIREFLEVNDE